MSVNKRRLGSRLRRRKVFCIGLNKTGTSALTKTASANRIRSLHHDQWWSLRGQEKAKKQVEAFCEYVRQHNAPPSLGHPGYPIFCHILNYDFFCDGGASYFDAVDLVFENTYYILNTRSLYNWLASRYNHRVRNREHYVQAERIQKWIIQREEYYRKVFNYFDGRDNFAVIDLETDDEADILKILQTATGKPIKRLHSQNVHKVSDDYDPNPAAVEAALTACNIPPAEWHRTRL